MKKDPLLPAIRPCAPGTLAIALAVALLHPAPLPAQVPNLIHYQGHVVTNAVNFEGTGLFKFALINGDGTVTYWSNDGTSAGGGPPAAAVALPAVQGLYDVLLGDASLANMSAIPATVFANSDVRLRVWFSDGVGPFEQLSPDQRIAAVGYALMAGTVPDGAISGAKLADGAVRASKLAANAVTAATLAPGSVTTASLADGAVTASKVYAVTESSRPIAFTNPTPALGEYFGDSVAALGADKILIGASGDHTGVVFAGAAYLFDLSGQQLTIFTNPTPEVGDKFGISIAAVGVDKVLIGAKDEDTGAADTGAAYLFDLAGH